MFFHLLDMNECEKSPCNTLVEICENTEGSYMCLCLQGFREENDLCRGNFYTERYFLKLYKKSFLTSSIY